MFAHHIERPPAGDATGPASPPASHHPMLWLGLGAAGLFGALVAPPGAAPGLLALGMIGVVAAIFGLDARQGPPGGRRFRIRHKVLRTRAYRVYRAWDAELARSCLLVLPEPSGTTDAVAALADARRTLGVGPAYHAARGAHGPFWVFGD